MGLYERRITSFAVTLLPHCFSPWLSTTQQVFFFFFKFETAKAAVVVQGRYRTSVAGKVSVSQCESVSRAETT